MGIHVAVDVGGEVVAAAVRGMSIAASEEGVYAATVDNDERIGRDAVYRRGVCHCTSHGSGTAAAIEHLDSIRAAMDPNLGTFAGNGDIVGLVAAAIDGLQGEGRSTVCRCIVSYMGEESLFREGPYLFCTASRRFPDINVDTVLGGSVDIVSAENHAVDGGAAKGIVTIQGTNVDKHGAVDVGCRAGIAQTATIDITANGALQDGDNDGVACLESTKCCERIGLTGSVHLGQCTASVNIAGDLGVSLVNQHRRAFSYCRHIAAAEDTAADGDM